MGSDYTVIPQIETIMAIIAWLIFRLFNSAVQVIQGLMKWSMIMFAGKNVKAVCPTKRDTRHDSMS